MLLVVSGRAQFLTRQRVEPDAFKKNIFCILFFLLAVPVTDETIQYFSEGRTPLVRDVLLDFSGGLFGLLICFLFVCIISAIKKRKGRNNQ
ncbi:MAG: VanZ family protein [Ruminococcus sp.]|nr:VanZ family protein [Ruminococcus sp.]